MSELVDRIPGEVILSSFHNAVKERTMMRYATLAALEGSIALPDPGSFAYLTTWPYPKTTGGTGFGGDGSPWIWAQDGDDTSPWSSGYRWQSLIRDSGGMIFGSLSFHGSALGSQNDPGSQFFKIDCTTDWRFRLLQAADGEAGVNVMTFAGNDGGSSYLRMPKGSGGFGIRERTGSNDAMRFLNGGPILLPRANIDASPFYPLQFTDVSWVDFLDKGITMSISGSSQLPGPLVIANRNSNSSVAMATTGPVSSSSERWMVGLTDYDTPGGGNNARRFERETGSSARWKHVHGTVEPDAATALLDALEVREFTYRDDYLPETDERAGQVMYGLIAEEVDSVAPILADHNEAGEPVNWHDRQLLALLVAAVQSLGARIGDLENAT